MGVTTIDIDGFETATFNGSDVFAVASQNFSYAIDGTGYAGINDLTNGAGMLFISRTTELNYDLATAYTFTGTNDSTTFSTTLGDLITTGASANATFTAALATVPEPSALALLGLGARRRMA